MTWPRALALLLIGAVFCWLYGPALDLFFTADDFVLLHYCKDTSAGEIVRTRLLGGLRGDLASPYWRPGWLLTLNAIYEGFGLTPRAFRVAIFGLHVLVALGVFVVAVRWVVRAPALALGACALFAWSPAYAEALTWIAAGVNVLPAAVCLFVAAVAYARYAEAGARRHLVVAWLGFLVAFTFREAAYHFPLVVFAAHAVLGPGPVLRRGARGALHALPFGVVVVLHNRYLNPFTVGHFSLAENFHLTGMHGAQWLRMFFALPDGATPIVTCLVLLVVAAILLPPRARFCLMWAAAATFPFVTRSHETRFLYFAHAPLALAVAALAARAAGGHRARETAAAVVLFGLAALNATRVPPQVALARARSATTRGVVELAQRLDLGRQGVVHVDFLPPELFDGLPELIALYAGGPTRVENQWVVARPPFLIHMNPEFADLEPEQTILHWDAASHSFVPTAKRDLVGGRQVVPMFGFRHQMRIVDDWSQIRFDPDTVHLLAPPASALDLSGTGENKVVERAGGTLSRIDLVVDAPRDAFLVIAFLADLETIGGRAFVDDVEVPLLAADALFNAIAVRAGSRTITLKTDK